MLRGRCQSISLTYYTKSKTSKFNFYPFLFPVTVSPFISCHSAPRSTSSFTHLSSCSQAHFTRCLHSPISPPPRHTFSSPLCHYCSETAQPLLLTGGFEKCFVYFIHKKEFLPHSVTLEGKWQFPIIFTARSWKWKHSEHYRRENNFSFAWLPVDVIYLQKRKVWSRISCIVIAEGMDYRDQSFFDSVGRMFGAKLPFTSTCITSPSSFNGARCCYSCCWFFCRRRLVLILYFVNSVGEGTSCSYN